MTKDQIVAALDTFLAHAKSDAQDWLYQPLDDLTASLREMAIAARFEVARAAVPAPQILVPNDGSDQSISAQQQEAQAALEEVPPSPADDVPAAPVNKTRKGRAAAAPAPAPADDSQTAAPAPAEAPAPAPTAAPAPALAEAPAADSSSS